MPVRGRNVSRVIKAMEDRDPDLSAQAKRCGELSANTPMLSAHVLEQALAAVYLLGESKSWQVRSGVLRFLQIIAFRHQFLMGKHGQLARIRDLMLSLLQVRICGEHLSLQLMADFKSWAQQQIPNTTAAIHQAPDFVKNSRETERRTFGEWTHKATSENTCENGSALGARTRLTQDADLSPAAQHAHHAGVDSRAFDSRACALACSGSAGRELTEDVRSTAALALDGSPHVGIAHVMGGMPRAATRTSQASGRNAMEEVKTEEVKREEEKPQEGNREEDKEAVKAAILRRHAGVLGLAALVGAYPYDVPAWMPEILVLLAQHVLDPMPIKQTVRKTFGEFWRTHQDTWPMLKVRFSEDDLNTLTNLLASPSYFS